MALTDTVRFVITLEKAELAKLARLATEAHTSIAEQVRQAVYRLPERAKRPGKVAGSPPPQAKTEDSSLTTMAHERTLDYSEGQ